MHDTNIRESLTRLAQAVDAAYNDADAAKMADCWTENGLNVNPFGDRFEGRASIEADLREALNGFMKGTQHELTITDVACLDDQTASADGIATITGISGDPSEALTSDFSMVCSRDGDRGWRVAQMRAYRFIPKHT